MEDFDETEEKFNMEFNNERAMNNAYMLITRKMSADTIMDLNPGVVNFPFTPLNYSNDDIQKVIDYYADDDEFEKCIELTKYKKNE